MSMEMLVETDVRENRDELAAATRRAEAGMTLLEILIVLGIIALVMGFLVGPQVMKKFAKAKIEAAYNMTQNIEGAYAKWQVDNPENECPQSIDDLKEHMGKRKTAKINDPWGHPYILKCGAEAPEAAEGFGVVSMGKDGKEGTSDDIKSWEKPKS